MPFPKEIVFTSKDYWNLPDGQRAELIDGQLYAMALPSRIHQKLSTKLAAAFDQYITSQGGSCEVYHAPFAVNLDANDHDWVEPDVSVICDKNKLTERGCCGAPDLVIEVVSPSSRRMDYLTKSSLYEKAGVREYWIVDSEKKHTTVYYYDAEGFAPTIFSFDRLIPVGIFTGYSIRIAELLNE